MLKADLIKQLKADALENKFALDGEYIVFDKTANLQYQILPSFKLGHLLTANPVSNTRLNVALLAVLSTIDAAFGKPITIRASYRSPEYNLLNFGTADSDLYTTGDALALGVAPGDVWNFYTVVSENFKPGEIGFYKWGVHLGWSTTPKEWDKTSDNSFLQKVKDFISIDKMKNILLLAAAAGAGWWFFLRKKS